MSPPSSPPPGGHDDADRPEGTLLSFHGDIVDELLERDGLTVMAEGLGLTTVLAGLLRAHALESGAAPARSPGSDALALAPVDPAPPSESGGGAVLLLGVSDAQKLALRLHLRRVAPWVAFPPEVTAEFAGNDRKQLYHRGGPMFVTTRIATVDMLAERLPPSRVAGLVIASAHRVTEFSGEAFAVRLFRAGNRRGFVRALTDRPGDLVRGFNTVERAMKSLMVRTLNLWPRFHLRARACLDAHAPEVVELRQPLTASARKIQDALVDVMRACMDELKRSRHVDTSELTLEAGLHRSFDRVLKRQLDPVWHVVTRKLKQIVYDLRTLREVAKNLLRYDAVTFLRYLETLRVAEGKESVWMFTDAAHVIFEEAKRRVYVLRRSGDPPGPGANEPARRDGGSAEETKKRKRNAGGNPPSSSSPCSSDGVEIVEEVTAPASMRPETELRAVLEPMPKWTLLEEIVAEIDAEKKARLQSGGKHYSAGAVPTGSRDAPVSLLSDDESDRDDPNDLAFARDVGKADESSVARTAAAAHRADLERAGAGPTLIVAKDDASAAQLATLLRLGGERMMRRLWADYLVRQTLGGGSSARSRGGAGARGGSRAGGGKAAAAAAARPRQQPKPPTSRMDRMRAAMMGEDPNEVGGGGGRGGGGGAAGGGRSSSSSSATAHGAGRGAARGAGLAGVGSAAERAAVAAAASAAAKEASKARRERAAPDRAAEARRAAAGHKVAAGDLDAPEPTPREPPSANGAKRRTTDAGGTPGSDDDDTEVAIVGEAAASSNADVLAVARAIHVRALSDARGTALDEIRPSFVIVFDPDAAFTREIETHKATRPRDFVRVYFMVHDTSVEEQRYLSSVRYETEAFDALVRAKQHMAMPAEMEGRLGDGAGLVAADSLWGRTRAHGLHDPPALPLPQLATRAEAAARARGGGALAVDARRRGGQLSTPTRLHVVVDVREFMSSLPSILHQSGFKLMPVTLEVGDYVLSPDICVERKSVPDLIGSLQSGRLYNQAEAMSKHYKMPVLLIEFERDKAFALQSLGDMSGDIALTSLQSKMCLLVLAFPKLRIMWSRSLHATAEMFAAFKIAEPEPAPEVAAAVGVPNGGDATGAGGRDEDPFNRAAIDFVRRLPGVTDANYRRVMDAVERPADLAEMSEEDLRIILGDQRQAKTLREFLHAPFPN